MPLDGAGALSTLSGEGVGVGALSTWGSSAGSPGVGSCAAAGQHSASKNKKIQPPPAKRRKTKFQADLAPAEDRTMRALKEELELASEASDSCGFVSIRGLSMNCHELSLRSFP